MFLGIETVTKIASALLGLVTNPRFLTDLLLFVAVVVVAAVDADVVVERTATGGTVAPLAAKGLSDPSRMART